MLLKKVSYSIFNELSFGRLRVSGRNNEGHITIRHRGGAVARLYRVVDFIKYIWDVRAITVTLEYDSNRAVLLALFAYTNGVFSFNLATQNIKVGATVSNTNVKLGSESRINYSANLCYLKPGIYINSLEFKPLKGAKYVRAAANYAKLVSVATSYSIIKLRSKSLLKVSNNCIATTGILSDKKLLLKERRKNAGFYRHLGVRPTVRGVAMNPIDHPHGGGQGKTAGGRASVTPWAIITKGKKTRRKVNYGSFILKR